MFDKRITFNLPRKWEFIEEKDRDGDKSYKICYNITRNSDGEKQAEETYNVMKRQKKNSLVSNIEGNFPVQVVGFAKDFNIGLSVGSSSGHSSNSQVKFKIYSGLAAIEYEDQYYIVSSMHLGQDDYKSRSEAAEEIASGLTKVLGFIAFDGEIIKIKTIPKSIILDDFKKASFELKTNEETPEEKASRLEREKKEREIRIEKERQEREAREKALVEQRKTEEERRRREEEERRKREEAARKAAAEAKAKVEAAQKVWEEEAARIRTIREDVLAKRLSDIEEIRENDLAVVDGEKNNALSQCESALEEVTKSVSDMETELSSLGIFAFGKKGELKKSIEAGKRKIHDLTSQKDSIIKTYEEKIAAVSKKADADSKNVRPAVEKEYPIPESPKEKERKRKEAEEAEKKRKEQEKAQKEVLSNLSSTEDELYYVLDRCRKEEDWATPSELASLAFGGRLENHPRTSTAMSFIRKLDKVGLIAKSTKDGKTVYRLKK